MLPIGIDFKRCYSSISCVSNSRDDSYFHWSVWEFVITEAMIILAFHAGGKNRISV